VLSQSILLVPKTLPPDEDEDEDVVVVCVPAFKADNTPAYAPTLYPTFLLLPPYVVAVIASYKLGIL
jgi:hypothetical protein